MKHAFPNFLALVVVLGFFGVVFMWMFHPPTLAEGPAAILNGLIGALTIQFGAVLQFYFGSSKGSQTKDDTISAMATNALPNGTATPTTATIIHNIGG